MTGKREAPKRSRASRLSKLVKRIGKIPHLFAKATIAYCILVASLASWYSLRILSRTGHDPAALLGVILGFFGGELLFLLLKTILNKNKTSDKNGGDTGI